jgi:hypothetical protein
MAQRLPASHPDAPGYWMNETSGALRPAVEAYLKSERLSLAQLGAMKAYLRQWVNSSAWDRNPYGGHEDLLSLRARVAAISDQADLDAAIAAATDIGMDPL